MYVGKGSKTTINASTPSRTSAIESNPIANPRTRPSSVNITTAVSGCSSTEAGPRQAGFLGTRICIENNFADEVNVTYTRMDPDASRKDPSYYEGDMPKDTETCAEEVGSYFDPMTVAGNLVIPGQPLPFGFKGSNDPIAAPGAWLTQRRDGGKYYCIKPGLGFDVGETRLWDNGTVRISITRQNDDQYKEFIIRIESSQGQRVGDDPCITLLTE